MHASLDTFGTFLRYLRKRMGMTQGDLAAAVGYSISFISSLESNRRLPTLEVIAEHFVPALGLTDEPRLMAQLVELAADARGEELPASLTVRRESHLRIEDDTVASCPIPPTPTVGRTTEVQQLCNRMIGHGGRLLTLLGPPGVGKTRLAIALATQLQTLYRDGCHFITLAAIEDPQLVASELATQLAIRQQAKSMPQNEIIAFLRRKEMLLVLDNFEQLLRNPTKPTNNHSSATQLLAEILAECPQVRIIVTSRERLHLRAEQQYRVQPLDLDAAVTLFVDCTNALADNIELAATDMALIESICQQLDCLPLAIELAAARMDTMAPATLLAHLQEHRLDLLTDGAVDLPPHQRTVRSAIQSSYALLTAAEQQLFRRLGVYSGGFDLAAVNACDASWSVLETLLSKNLIYLASNLGERRFAMLQIIREFALEALAAVDEEMTMRRQHAAYYSLLAQRVATQPPEGEKGQQLRQLEADHDNLRAALEWLIVHEPAGALNLALLLEEFWAARGYDVEAAQRLQAVLKSNPGPIAARASGLLALANVHRRLGDYDAAGLALQSVAQLLESHELNAAIRLKFYRSSGWQHYDLHDYTQTVAYFQKGLALARAENQTSSIIQFLAALAHTQRDRPERHTQVAAYLAEALRLLKTWDDPETLAFVLQQAGGVAVAAEQYDVAGAHYAQMVTIYRRIGNKLGLGWALALVGEVAWFQDDSVTAETQYLEAHAIFYALENLDGIMIMLHHLGQTARRQGRLDEARHYYQQSLLVAEQLHNRHMRARGLAGLSYVALAQGDVAQAAALAGAAQQLFDTLPPFLAIPDQHEFSVLVATIRRDPTPAVAAAWAEGLLLGETSSHKR